MAFKDIIGQDKAIRIIGKTLARNRVPSAYLFAGEYGIGKKLTAINLAKAINCLNPVRNDSSLATNHLPLIDCCDECTSCRKINSGTHPDFLIVTPEKGEIRVGGIRAVVDALSYRPYEGTTKVVVIDDADAMNQSASNAFLKTLEEPPDESLLVLITARQDALPETIRSRCSRINFLPLSDDACEKVIRAALAGSGKETGSVPVIARLTMGRPGLAFYPNLSNAADIADAAEGRERFAGLLRSMLNDSSEIWDDREEIARWLDMAFILLRDLVLTKIIRSGNEDARASVDQAINEGDILNADLADLISGSDRAKDIMSVIDLYYKLSVLRKEIAFNLNKAITWNYTASMMKTVMAGS